ncbi:hypothetical protein [Telluribacter sp. SYSU D00476]|uniref:hypothetical protein n=1 Tax=Telluribacter sp. SYSU D00476 TaxID=2811430 RepID=UPI001FF4E763|nr:hypothetical protein [Telluribacter sp. SYSU D00476]
MVLQIHLLQASGHILLTRVVSKPAPDSVATNLRHKAVAAENPIDRRIRFLNLEEYEVLN